MKTHAPARLGLFLVAVLAAGCSAPGPVQPASTPSAGGIQKIKHVVVIMQENRSFDSYFGTFPGADGIPMANGVPTVCAPDAAGTCIKPYHDSSDKNAGGPHGQTNATADVNGGKMDGFVTQAEGSKGCLSAFDPNCSNGKQNDVMGYHDQREIPNYWSYAQTYTLQDRMFEPNASWSLPEHLFMVSEWSANCASSDPNSCQNALQSPGQVAKKGGGKTPIYAWTDLTYLMYKHQVAWKYYVAEGTQPDCENDAATCSAQPQKVGTPEIWNPLPWFTTVKQDNQLGNIQTVDHFYSDAKAGTLPAVSWVVPNGAVSEHPPALVSAGQTYVTNLVNAIMSGPDWSSTAIFLALGRLGRLLRPRHAAHRRPERLRAPRPGDRDQPLREAGLHRPPGAQLRRLRQVHRGRLSVRPAARPEDRRSARPAARRAREREPAGQPDRRFQLRPATVQTYGS